MCLAFKLEMKKKNLAYPKLPVSAFCNLFEHVLVYKKGYKYYDPRGKIFRLKT